MTNKLFLLALLIGINFSINSYAEADNADEVLSFHVIHNEDIQEIMQRLTRALYNKEKDIKPYEEIDIEHAQKLFDLASELYLAAGKLELALPGIKLTEDEKNVFVGLARQLQIEANKLAYLRDEKDQPDLEVTFKRLNDTCAACHELFRF